MNVILNDQEYTLIKNYRDGFDLESVTERATEYFNEYDYIFGDWAYGKLRLKGFYNKGNKAVKNINNIEILDEYIEKNCAYGCRYFLLEKKDIVKKTKH